jgi:hypothetical protein
MEDDYDYEDGDYQGYCDTCNNSGFVNCYCCGDLCCCENQGEYECPDCGEY